MPSSAGGQVQCRARFDHSVLCGLKSELSAQVTNQALRVQFRICRCSRVGRLQGGQRSPVVASAIWPRQAFEFATLEFCSLTCARHSQVKP